MRYSWKYLSISLAPSHNFETTVYFRALIKRAKKLWEQAQFPKYANAENWANKT